MVNLLNSLLLFGQFIPHGHCYLWKPGMVWLHVIADGLTALAYYSIPITLLYFVRKRRDLPFDWIFLLFSAFIIACGTTHAIEIWTLWHPDYWFSGMMKAVTASVSVYTAMALVPLVPQALALPNPDELKAANQALRQQITARQQAEKEVRLLNAELEQRIAERTRELELANQVKEELLIREQTARAEAETTNQLKDEFLAVLSHELRTPLNAIMGWAQLLRTRTFPAQTSAQALETIERNSRSLARMIDDLLDVSRIIRGKMHLSVGLVNLQTAVQMAIETIRPAADAKSIQIHFSISDQQAGPSPYPVLPAEANKSGLISRDRESAFQLLGDLDRLQQVIWNLLSNAVKFTPVGGRVEIRLGQTSDHLELQIQDTGQGIAAEFLPHVFDHFRQADSSTTRSQGGLGLGLAIVRRLVELHGGQVQASSAGMDQGSIFTVTFPRTLTTTVTVPVATTALPQRSNAAPNTIHHPEALAGLTLLVVDDEVEARNLLATALAQYGAKVESAANVPEAIAAFRTARPDVLISDIGMPEQDGYTLIQHIRNLTAYVSAEDRLRALEAGFQHHLPKPVDPDELVLAIVRLAQETSQASIVSLKPDA
jgi:signal transduction histidine kinase